MKRERGRGQGVDRGLGRVRKVIREKRDII